MQSYERNLDQSIPEPVFWDYCEKCGWKITTDDECWTDLNGTPFCSENCAKEYYEIKEIEVDPDELEYDRKLQALEQDIDSQNER
jgi:hypothetical protein